MKKLGLNELRELYLSFFESKGHLRLPSFPLVPINDKSLLLINAGMAPLKPYFSGEQEPPRRRVTTCQKCVRVLDIERVGKTARHGTYFEMLGNFSFGDYFKKEALSWSWEFLTGVLEIPPELLWASIYEDDDEAYDIWINTVGIDPTHVVRMGKEDNFWECGVGPCGPCSEIYFDRGVHRGCGSPDCRPGCDCDRYVEVWNNVFTQFSNDGSGNYTPLAQKNIDTGMGLERLACVMQDVESLFEVDTVRRIMKNVIDLTGARYGESTKNDISLRVITDHIRSSTFLIGDGVLPSNEGRGYVLRRLIRRAARHGRLLGLKEPFLYKICETVIEENRTAYPQLAGKRDFIIRVLSAEEERFSKTVDSGMDMLFELIANMEQSGTTVLSGNDAFRLYDTYGFPVDLTLEILDEKGLTLDRETFDALMDEQRERARSARTDADELAWAKSGEGLYRDIKTKFVGYDTLECEASVISIAAEGEAVGALSAGQSGVIVLDRTPFYGESGGQVGDTGILTGPDNAVFEVHDTKKAASGAFLHSGFVASGSFTMDMTAAAKVDIARRAAIMRAHSSVHLLQKALRMVLGNHVEQAGSYVSPDSARFDFTHFSAMTPEELTKVEALVNESILSDLPVTITEMPIDEARKLGAMALFGEKYGKTVRVVRMGDFSMELCGGTHLSNTAKAGLFKIVSESSVAAGVRRIEAVTGAGVLSLLSSKQELINETAKALKSAPTEIVHRSYRLIEELREANHTCDKLNAILSEAETTRLLEKSVSVKGVDVITAVVPDASAEILRAMGDTLRDKAPNTVAVLAAVNGESILFTCACGAEAVKKGAHAGNIIRETAKITGGGGGGRPDSATAGGRDASKLRQALDAVNNIVEKMIK